MSERINHIQDATTRETALKIIDEDNIRVGVGALKWYYGNLYPDPDSNSLAPIMQAGIILARDLAGVHGQVMNPIRMTYYKADGKRLPAPVCKSPLDIRKVVDFENGKTRDVSLVECVVDTQGTLLAAIDKINSQIDDLNKKTGNNFSYPNYSVFAILSKIQGRVQIPNFYYAYDFNPDIWAYGYGCDADGKERLNNSMFGYLSPFALTNPKLPYYSASDQLQEYLQTHKSDPLL